MAYTTIDDPSAHFHIRLYTGNNLTTQTITNNANAGDFQADWLWIKNRDDIEQHHLMDSNRGANKFLHSNASDDEREGSYNGGHNDINAFGSNGFTITSNGSGDELNFGTRLYVAWQWKANGGTTTTNDASATSVGSLDSVYQANTTAGFSIVTYTGAGGNQTIAHGLGAVPSVMMIKRRDDAGDWTVYHSTQGDEKFLRLNANNALGDQATYFNDTTPTSTVFTVGSAGDVNTSSGTHVAYCFTPIQGYSKFGSYKGNGNTDGRFLYLGFKPALIIVKATDTDNWRMYDNKRANAHNVIDVRIIADTNAAESQDDNECDFLSNGVKWRSSSGGVNSSGQEYIYMAFAEHPFVSSTGIPVTAR